MTGPIVQQARVRTNKSKDSTHTVEIRAITFTELWENYVTGDPFKPDPADKADYSNQCALRLSATFHRLGIEMKSFSQKTVRPMPGAKVLGRVLMNGRPAATRAYELGEWLKVQPFAGLPRKPEDVTGKDWESRVKGRTGIIMFHGYWLRSGEDAGNASGGHIDLWNGERMPISSATSLFSVLGRRFGYQDMAADLSFGYSDLRNSKLILFWEIK
ncbi:MAG: hypothetical protein J0H69_06315 [Burkholderiales bacterium]|nr:hypothetical protein [Burkholderiales bacterium]